MKNKKKKILSKKQHNISEIGFKDPKKSISLFIEGASRKISRYDEINKTIKELEAEKKSIENTIKENMKDLEEVYIDNRKITYKAQTRISIDTKLLKQDHPQLIESYIKTSTYKVFKM